MNDPGEKMFKRAPSQIRAIVAGHGSCIASDKITVEGLRVGFAYREPPSDKFDSGWRFMSGAESDDYVNDPQHLSIYDVNTIVNYDPDIIPFLDAPVGSAFERANGVGSFVEVKDNVTGGQDDTDECWRP